MDGRQKHHDVREIYSAALSCHQAGETAKAINLYKQLTDLLPEVAEIHYNLGLALFEDNSLNEAVKAYRRAAALRPDDTDILYNLGLAYKQGLRFIEAQETYQKGLALAPDDVEMRYNLGCCCKDAGEIDRAIAEYEEVLTRAPDYAPALNNLAYLRHRQGQYDQATEHYARLLELRPDHAAARYMLTALTGASATAPPQDYVRDLFDQYSETFERNLVQDLEYTTPLQLKQAFDQLSDRKPMIEFALDLGCGTGLAGAAFRPLCNKLAGIDLSGRMIEQADTKGIYDELHVGDIEEYLTDTRQRYDLFIAADVLTYLSDLQPLFEAVWKCSTRDALFCFSTETTTEPGRHLQPTGRYAHHPGYIDETAHNSGWHILHCSEADIRKERDTRIRGNIFILSKKE